MAKLTISEALGVQKILDARYSELVSLRNQNSVERTLYRGANADKEQLIKPTYDVKELDKTIAGLAREKRLLDSAMKKTNATVDVTGYDWNDAVLGELK